MLEKYRRLWNRHVMHGFDVPESLHAITRIDHAREVDAQAAGLRQNDVDALWHNVEDFYRSAMHPMVGICIRRHGEIVLNRTIGYVSGVVDDGPLVVADIATPVCLFSASKSVTAILAHKAAEENFFNLLDPVSYYIPAFAANGKGNVTIHQLLSHRAGVPRLPDVPMETLFDHDAVLKLVCAATPLDRDGRVTAYHAITSGFVLAELIRVTTGKTLQQYLDDTVRRPMGMQNFRYGLLPEQRHLAPTHYVTGLPLGPVIGGVLKQVLGVDAGMAIGLSNRDAFKSAVIPSANLYATAEETSRFFQMLLDHGDYVDPATKQRQQILQPLTVHGATRETGKTQIDKSLFLPMRYSAGMMLGGEPAGIYGLHTHYAYGHIGFSNVFCWADPQRDISVALLTSGKPVIGSHMVTLLKLMHSISSICAPCVDMTNDEPQYLKRKARVS